MLIVTKHKCPYSLLAIKELNKRKIKYIKMEVSDHSNGEAVRSYNRIKQMTGHKTFPVIFLENGRKIGGYTELIKFLRK